MNYTANDHTYVLCAYKESEFLEECINSLLSQTVKSSVLIATSTPNRHITDLAEKYGIEVFVNNGEKGIGGDWNFAVSCAKTPLVTIAHQDDIYEPEYTEAMLSLASRADNPIICFSGYGELRDGEKVYKNSVLMVKRLLLSPLKIKVFWKNRFVRRRVLSLGNCICCPAVTYVIKNTADSPFTNDYKSNIDWQQWERLSKKKGSFAYTARPLMCHRIHEASTTSEVIGEDDGRSREDYDMYLKFWPQWVARLLMKGYSKSQDSNKV